jgi:hypothetical protein
VDKLVADVELRYRSVNSAETDNSSLVIDHPELANSERNDLGSISGYHALTRDQVSTRPESHRRCSIMDAWERA